MLVGAMRTFKSAAAPTQPTDSANAVCLRRGAWGCFHEGLSVSCTVQCVLCTGLSAHLLLLVALHAHSDLELHTNLTAQRVGQWLKQRGCIHTECQRKGAGVASGIV